MNKHKLFQEVESRIVEQIANAERAQGDSQDEANRHVGRMQSRYDTFKEEAQQMAAAHELRKIELTRSLLVMRNFMAKLGNSETGGAIKIGSVILLETLDGQKQESVVLSPVGGGIELMFDGEKITVITPTSPLGQVLIDKVGGEKVNLELDKKTITRAILEVI